MCKIKTKRWHSNLKELISEHLVQDTTPTSKNGTIKLKMSHTSTIFI